MIPDEYCLDLVFTSLRSLLSSLFDIRLRLILAFSNIFCRFYPSGHQEKVMFLSNQPDSQLFYSKGGLPSQPKKILVLLPDTKVD